MSGALSDTSLSAREREENPFSLPLDGRRPPVTACSEGSRPEKLVVISGLWPGLSVMLDMVKRPLVPEMKATSPK